MKDMKSRHYPLIVVFALLAFAASMWVTARIGWRHTDEQDIYLGYAVSIARGEGYRACPSNGYFMCEDTRSLAWRLPVYPLFLSVLVNTYGESDPLPAIRLTQSMLCALCVGLAVGLAARLRGRMAAILCGAFILIWLPFYNLFTMLYTEALFAPLVLVLVYMLLYKRRRAFWVGVSVGILMLTRGTLLFTIPLLLLLFPRRQWTRFAVGAALIIGAWTFRNALMLNAFVPFSTSGGAVLYGANNAYAWEVAPGYWMLEDHALFDDLPEPERDRALSRAALDYLRQQDLERLLNIALTKVRTLLQDG